MAMAAQLVDQRLIHDLRRVVSDADPPLFAAHRFNRRVLHALGNRSYKFVGKGDRMAGTAEIVGHLDEARLGALSQLEHVV